MRMQGSRSSRCRNRYGGAAAEQPLPLPANSGEVGIHASLRPCPRCLPRGGSGAALVGAAGELGLLPVPMAGLPSWRAWVSAEPAIIAQGEEQGIMADDVAATVGDAGAPVSMRELVASAPL